MKVTKVPETIKITFEDGFYCMITPSVEADGYRDFWMYRKGFGLAEYMFGLKVENDEEAVELAVANAKDAILGLYETILEDE